jgi:hypothetical protein
MTDSHRSHQAVLVASPTTTTNDSFPVTSSRSFAIKRPPQAAAAITGNDHAEPDREHTLRPSGSNGPAASGEHA